jgi:hypothetical protein
MSLQSITISSSSSDSSNYHYSSSSLLFAPDFITLFHPFFYSLGIALEVGLISVTVQGSDHLNSGLSLLDFARFFSMFSRALTFLSSYFCILIFS